MKFNSKAVPSASATACIYIYLISSEKLCEEMHLCEAQRSSIDINLSFW